MHDLNEFLVNCRRGVKYGDEVKVLAALSVACDYHYYETKEIPDAFYNIYLYRIEFLCRQYFVFNLANWGESYELLTN